MNSPMIRPILYMILGALLLIKPDSSLLLVQLTGVALILCAVFLGYTGLEARKSDDVTTGNESTLTLFSCAVCAVVGVVFLISPGVFVSLVFVALGIIIMVSAALDLVPVLREGRASQQLGMVILDIVALVVGLAIMIHPGGANDMLWRIVGLLLLINGVLGLVDIIRNPRRTVVDTTTADNNNE